MKKNETIGLIFICCISIGMTLSSVNGIKTKAIEVPIETASPTPAAVSPSLDYAISSMSIYETDLKVNETSGVVPENSNNKKTVHKSANAFKPYDLPLKADLQKFIFKQCHKSGVSYELVLALIEHESGFRSNIISKTDDYGLMQINSINHEWLIKELGISDFCNPEDNIRAGIYMLKQISEKYDDAYMMLMVYNMGEANAKKLWGKGIYSSKYARIIITRADELKTRGR